MREKDSSKQILLSVLGVAILVVAVVGVSFAAFSYTGAGEKVNSITTGTITMNYSETSNAIEITDALPISDTAGKALTGDKNVFDFTVSATIQGTATINYAISAAKDESSTLPDEAVKLFLTSGESTEELAPTKVSEIPKAQASNTAGVPEGQMLLKSASTSTNVNDTYHLRMWIADDYAGDSDTGIAQGQTYKVRVNVYGKAAAQ